MALMRYVVGATLARTAGGGAAVGLVLLAVDRLSGHAELVGGLLAAGLTAPHLLGPILGRRLDQARDGRWFLCSAFLLFGAALAAAGFLLGRAPLLIVVMAVVVAGLCGPLLTGGLSSRVADLTSADQRSRRRGEAWDSVSYGVAGTAGPAGVAAVSTLTSPFVAILVLAAAAIVAAGPTLTLPQAPTRDRPAEVATVRTVLSLMLRDGRLRRVNYATVLTSVSAGGMSVIAVVMAAELTGRSSSGAVLIAMTGAGSLVGALVLTAVPLEGEPDRLTTYSVLLIGAATGLAAVAPTYRVALLAFVAIGLANAVFVVATFAARSEYAPPGARAQVFITMASLKVAAASAGAALAGLASSLGPRGLPAAAAVVVLSGGLATIIDRQADARRSPGSPGQPAS
ncbi:hypothetical protein OG394_00825 [Kribbella sp. NBC_01245]|uniref:hypothetical protein n=1 Tax=Kribbella sp. NBC_01245 TaxID=2903578 RepID=UPI002E27E29D|nr:hypothetical protein [Kribbella sp. NBC_01245]